MSETTGLQVTCEKCHHVNPVPAKIIQEAAGRIINAMRMNPRGKDRVIYKCNCGQLLSAREFRAHESVCEVKPSRAAVVAHPHHYHASGNERKKYFEDKGLKRKG